MKMTHPILQINLPTEEASFALDQLLKVHNGGSERFQVFIDECLKNGILPSITLNLEKLTGYAIEHYSFEKMQSYLKIIRASSLFVSMDWSFLVSKTQTRNLDFFEMIISACPDLSTVILNSNNSYGVASYSKLTLPAYLILEKKEEALVILKRVAPNLEWHPVNPKGKTPLMMAVLVMLKHPGPDKLNLLSRVLELTPDISLSARWEALYTGLQQGSRLQEIELLLQGITREEVLNHTGSSGLLAWAASGASYPVVQYLVDTFPELVAQSDEEGNTALHRASLRASIHWARSGDVDDKKKYEEAAQLVMLLLERGAVLRTKNKNGQKPTDFWVGEDLKSVYEKYKLRDSLPAGLNLGPRPKSRI